jgi:hypothetical protein
MRRRDELLEQEAQRIETARVLHAHYTRVETQRDELAEACEDVLLALEYLVKQGIVADELNEYLRAALAAVKDTA